MTLTSTEFFDTCAQDPLFHSRGLLAAADRLSRKRAKWLKAKKMYLAKATKKTARRKRKVKRTTVKRRKLS